MTFTSLKKSNGLSPTRSETTEIEQTSLSPFKGTNHQRRCLARQRTERFRSTAITHTRLPICSPPHAGQASRPRIDQCASSN